MTTEYSFRYLDSALATPLTRGVRHVYVDGGLRLEFFVDDPSGQADFVVVSSVIVDPTAVIDMVQQIEQNRYQMPPE